MPYTPDPDDVVEPLDTRPAKSAAAEFRALKTHVKNTIDSIQATADPYAPDRMKWLGDFVLGTTYIKNDIVTNGASVFICLVTNTSEALVEGTYWDIMLEGLTESKLLAKTKPSYYAGEVTLPIDSVFADKLWLRNTVAENFPFCALPNPAMGHIRRSMATPYTDLYSVWLNESRNMVVRGDPGASHMSGANSGIGLGSKEVMTFHNSHGTMAPDDKFMQLHGAFDSMFALTEKGDIFFRGVDIIGLNGDGAATSRYAWTKVAYVGSHVIEGGLPADVIAMIVGFEGSHNAAPDALDKMVFAIDSSKRLWAWGSNTNGGLGVGDTSDRLQPTLVTSMVDVEMVVSNGYSSYAINSAGDVYACGKNNFGQLGNGTSVDLSAFTQVTGIGYTVTQPVIQLTMKSFTGAVCHILTDQGEMYGAGYNLQGQIGDSTTVHRSSFTRCGAGTFSSFYTVGDLGLTVYALGGTPSAPAKDLWVWGRNTEGQCATGDLTTPKTTPGRPSALASNSSDITVNNAVLSAVISQFPRDDVDGIFCMAAMASSYTYGVIIQAEGKLWFFGYSAGFDLGGANTSAGAIAIPTILSDELDEPIVDVAWTGQTHSSQCGMIFQLASGKLLALGYNVSAKITDDKIVVNQLTAIAS